MKFFFIAKLDFTEKVFVPFSGVNDFSVLTLEAKEAILKNFALCLGKYL